MSVDKLAMWFQSNKVDDKGIVGMRKSLVQPYASLAILHAIIASIDHFQYCILCNVQMIWLVQDRDVETIQNQMEIKSKINDTHESLS